MKILSVFEMPKRADRSGRSTYRRHNVPSKASTKPDRIENYDEDDEIDDVIEPIIAKDWILMRTWMMHDDDDNLDKPETDDDDDDDDDDSDDSNFSDDEDDDDED
jgi:hypothetical protein